MYNAIGVNFILGDQGIMLTHENSHKSHPKYSRLEQDKEGSADR